MESHYRFLLFGGLLVGVLSLSGCALDTTPVQNNSVDTGYWCLDLEENCLPTTEAGVDQSTGEQTCNTKIYSSQEACLQAAEDYDWQEIETIKGTQYELVTTTENNIPVSVSTHWCLDLEENCFPTTPGGIDPVTGQSNCSTMIYSSQANCQAAGQNYDWKPVETAKGTQYELVEVNNDSSEDAKQGLACQTDNDCGKGGGCSECVEGHQSCNASSGICLPSGFCERTEEVVSCDEQETPSTPTNVDNSLPTCNTNADCGSGYVCDECVDGQRECTTSKGICMENGICEVVRTTESCGEETTDSGLSCQTNDDCSVGGGCGDCIDGKQECSSSSGICLPSGFCENNVVTNDCTE